MKSAHRSIERYLERHATDRAQGVAVPPPDENLRICLVIPAYDELSTIGAVVDSVGRTCLGAEEAEIIVCVNHGTDAPRQVVDNNRATVELLDTLDSPFPIHVIDRASPGSEFPADDAGVGRARRLLMDLATRRLHQVGRHEDGLIACLDGDSPADPGYFEKIWEEMSANPNALAGHCRYRHPIPDDDAHARAIVAYESWMRYFETALRLTGTPYAYHSIGSCMVVTARGYALADGVPPREALSDFYLLQKITKAGGPGSVIQLRQPLVRPSARLSSRVPRGTGPSVRAVMNEQAERFELVEPPRAFFDLRELFRAVPSGFRNPEALRRAASPFLTEILERWNGFRSIDKLRRHAPDERRFERQFHTWFDSLKIVKYANRAREKWGATPLFEALCQIHSGISRTRHGSAIGGDDLDSRIKLLEFLRETAVDHFEAPAI